MTLDAATSAKTSGQPSAHQLVIRPATAADGDAIWRIFHAVVGPGDTYAFAADTPRDEALDYFLAPGVVSFVAESNGVVVAMYKMIPNRRDRGAHVANASFMVDPTASGRGIGWAIGRHCLAEAWARGYLSMQFNFVISTNTRAVKLWERLGFSIVGRSPRGFRHRDLGDVDALVMYRALDDPNVGGANDIPRFVPPSPVGFGATSPSPAGFGATSPPCVVRPSAYVVIANGGGEIAVVRTAEGVFLPGGGVDAGESADAAARRETAEECAFDVTIEAELGRAADIVWSAKESTCFEKRCVFFRGMLGARRAGTPEHEVAWLHPSEALMQLTREGHRWAVARWRQQSA